MKFAIAPAFVIEDGTVVVFLSVLVQQVIYNT